MGEVAQIREPATTGEDSRARLGKLIGMLGSAHAGERANALDAIDRELKLVGLTWRWLGELAASKQLPGGDWGKLLSDLVDGRLKRGLIYGCGLTGEEAKLVKEISARCHSGLGGTSVAVLRQAISIADEAVRRVRG